MYFNCFHHFRLSVNDIPPISVKRLGDKWFTADNRRLWVFRNLERLGICSYINVIVTNYIPEGKFTTINGGESVYVRGFVGGRWYKEPAHQIPTTNFLHIPQENLTQDQEAEEQEEEEEEEKVLENGDVDSNEGNMDKEDTEENENKHGYFEGNNKTYFIVAIVVMAIAIFLAYIKYYKL